MSNSYLMNFLFPVALYGLFSGSNPRDGRAVKYFSVEAIVILLEED